MREALGVGFSSVLPDYLEEEPLRRAHTWFRV